MEIKKGEIWRVESRGFSGVFRVLEDIDTEKDAFFGVFILEGVKSYLNREYKHVGDIVNFRTTLTEFISECEEVKVYKNKEEN